MRRLGHDDARCDELRHVVDVARGRVWSRVLNQPERQPDHLVDPEPLAQQRFVVGAAQPEIAVVQQALLGREQCALAVGVEGAALECERRLVETRAPRLGDATRHLGVLVVRSELLIPAVEAEPDRRDATVGIAHEDRSVVADPGVVERHDEDVEVGAEESTRLGFLRGVDDDRDRLEPIYAARHLSPLAAGITHERTEEVLTARP